MPTRNQILGLLLTCGILMAVGPWLSWILDEVRRIKRGWRR